jgi:DNA-binding transcriptional LysR family regulator
MDRFAAIEAFVRVVEAGGFSQAARVRGVAPSSLTRQIGALEKSLGTRLLHCTTHAVTVTEAGRVYYEQAVRILEDLQAADGAIAGLDTTPQGILRVSAPVVFGQLHVAPLLAGFLRACPAVSLEISFTDVLVDLRVADIDVAIRLGSVGNLDLIARRLAPQRRILCASPDYLSTKGTPDSPAALAAHDCLVFAYRSGPLSWRFGGSDGPSEVQVSGPLRADNSDVLREAAVAGLGLILMPDWLVSADLAAGRLVEVLATHVPTEADGAGIHAVWLPNRRGSPKVSSVCRISSGPFYRSSDRAAQDVDLMRRRGAAQPDCTSARATQTSPRQPLMLP